ncbi:MAG: FAD-binding oxidoreductase [Candidatus Gastranaerophilaceae bacterium]|jgi:dihydroorotate dehydrogenase electron transfer subunit
MKKNHNGTIKNIKEINKNVYSLEFSTPTLDNILPGEYMSILCHELTLRRPFSVMNFEDGRITVLFKKKGKGTQYIANLKVGDNIEFSAPLGNTFKIENKKTLLVGAGIGVAPLFYMNKKLKETGAETFFAAGFLNKPDIIGEFDFVSTDDGSNGYKGSICDFVEKIIEDFNPEKIVSCAPHPVLKFIAQTAQKNGIESEVAMEKIMACGIGVCRGCVIQIKKDGKIQNATVCKDGPVFKGEEVVW